MKKTFLRILAVLAALYIVVCALLYFYQEHLIFRPQKLASDFKFALGPNVEELGIKLSDNVVLSGLLFKSDSSQGLVFYLHGNAGSINSWAQVAKTYTDLHYDLFLLDYRGYGKSEGNITSQDELFHDVQTAYDQLKAKYDERHIVVIGYSIGTGLAAYVAAKNHPKLLILQAPYYSLSDLVTHTYPVIPSFILKYKLETNLLLPECNMPIVIFHGTDDKVIYYNSSVKLKGALKPADTLITLTGQGHRGITFNPTYRVAIEKLLSK